jgi:hypothetical protein
LSLDSGKVVEEFKLDSLGGLKYYGNYKMFLVSDEDCVNRIEYKNFFESKTLIKRVVKDINEGITYPEFFTYKSDKLYTIKSKNDNLIFEYEEEGRISKITSDFKTIYYKYEGVKNKLSNLKVCYENDCKEKVLNLNFSYNNLGRIDSIENNYNLLYKYYYNPEYQINKIELHKENKIYKTYNIDYINGYKIITEFDSLKIMKSIIIYD